MCLPTYRYFDVRRYGQYKDRTASGLGYDTKVEEIGQFFKGGGRRADNG